MAQNTETSRGSKVHPSPPPAALAPGVTTGPDKAAMWLLSADEELAVAALRLLTNDEARRLRRAVEQMQKISPDLLGQVHSEFYALIEQQPLRLRGSLEYLGQLANQAWGEQKASALLRAVDGVPPATALLEADVEALSSVLAEEHPQIIAAIMATLTPERASELLRAFPPEISDEVVSRLARLTKVPQAALVRAQQILSAGLPVFGAQDYDIDGVRVAATLLNQLEAERAERILAALAEQKAELATDVRQAMFTFEDLGRLDRRNLQTLLKEVASDRLMLALKAASEELKAKIFAGLSKRAADMLKEDLKMMGPARLADVEQAQEEIVGVALKLQSDGKLTIAGGGGDFV